MTLYRRRLMLTLGLGLGLVLANDWSNRAAAADGPKGYPDHTVRIIVPFPAGGTADTLPRIVGQYLSKRWNQPVVIENKSGAGGNIGAAYVATSPADGYTLLASPPGPLAINQSLYKPASLGFKPPDMVPITVLGAVPNVLDVRPGFPAKTAQELIAYAKANPGKVNFGSAGVGSVNHITGEYFAREAGITLVHVPYKGTGPALTDLLGDHIPMALAPIPAVHANVSAGLLRALATTGKTRSKLMPDVPTIAETGMPGFEASLYYGLVAPAGTPRPIIDKLNQELRAALASDEVKKQLSADGTEITPSTPEAYSDFIDKDEKKWSELVKASGVEPE